MIAADSNRVNGFPPGPSGSTIAGMRWLGLIFRNSGLNWSPAPISIGITLYARPSSSSAMCTLWPFGVGQVQTSSIAPSPACAAGINLRKRAEWQAGPQYERDAAMPILVETRPGYRLITLNRPERLNALTVEMADALMAALADAEADKSCRALLITGAGRAFCAGQDLTQIAGIAPAEIGHLLDHYNPLIAK